MAMAMTSLQKYMLFYALPKRDSVNNLALDYFRLVPEKEKVDVSQNISRHKEER